MGPWAGSGNLLQVTIDGRGQQPAQNCPSKRSSPCRRRAETPTTTFIFTLNNHSVAQESLFPAAFQPLADVVLIEVCSVDAIQTHGSSLVFILDELQQFSEGNDRTVEGRFALSPFNPLNLWCELRNSGSEGRRIHHLDRLYQTD